MFCLRDFIAFILCALLLIKLSHGSEIINGREVEPHSLPYMALLELNQPACGGILVDPKWVLTAAHCIKIKTVLLGVHSIKEKKKEQKCRQIRKVKKSIPHPCYDSKERNNDLMLLKLDKAVKETQWVKTLKLNKVVKEPAAGSVCKVAGWGKTDKDATTMSDVLMSTNVTVINRTKCNSKDYYNLDPYITKNMICAGWNGKIKADTCKGDSGGPILCNEGLVGVTSFGRECGIQNKPGVYAFLTEDNLKLGQEDNEDNKMFSLWGVIALFLTINSSHGSEIINGKEVKPHSLPYMALLESSQPVCGGILIDPNWVLTAAHCEGVKTVLLGVHSIKEKKNEQQYRQILKVSRSVPHPCFDSKEKNNDLMLLKLDKAVKHTESVSSLKLNDVVKEPAAGSVCMVAGWGQTKKGGAALSDVLMSANVTVIDRMKCNSKKYYQLRPYITKNMICAGASGKIKGDTCQGDSGGPILCNGAVVGVASFGYKCGIKNKPGVYAFLTEDHLKWIKKTMKTPANE
ncbi:uncharacterized protein LOC129366021 [Poeciliopsis prolifica]|uniref:uncharacterized protein LOC129366021 n=1 Tax=Poeciliopsis prolifica TaxID=188132 RepID=UPI002412F54E|nr:uncharacterized protein LOC129366021 [Poeciliopsis prolifica]